MRRIVRAGLAALVLLGFVRPALAAETLTYTYDAKGRLVKVVHSGTVNNGVQTSYAHDKVDNRKNKKTTGAP